jgi:hypothetical protein
VHRVIVTIVREGLIYIQKKSVNDLGYFFGRLSITGLKYVKQKQRNKAQNSCKLIIHATHNSNVNLNLGADVGSVGKTIPSIR